MCCEIEPLVDGCRRGTLGTMKRVKVRPGATVPVNDEMLARARDALAAFGVQEQRMRPAMSS